MFWWKISPGRRRVVPCTSSAALQRIYVMFKGCVDTQKYKWERLYPVDSRCVGSEGCLKLVVESPIGNWVVRCSPQVLASQESRELCPQV